MEVTPFLVAYHSVYWIRVAVESYLDQFPGERLLVVDNNPRRGEFGWFPYCEEERAWLAAHPAVLLIDNPRLHLLPDGRLEHGSGMDAALAWARAHGTRVLVHLEPDCSISGRQWRENLLQALDQGAWMAGSFRQSHGPIHPTPSAWLVAEVRASFRTGSWGAEERHPRFTELIHTIHLESDSSPEGRWIRAVRWWDTGHRSWFEAAAQDRAALVETPGFRHYWYGSVGRRFSEATLAGQFPELRPFLDRARLRVRPRAVEQCPYRQVVPADEGTEVACCRLLQQFSGVTDACRCAVPREACSACCASAPPYPEQLNPVVASLLCGLTEEVIGRGGVPGCTAAVAADLRLWAEAEVDLCCPDTGTCGNTPMGFCFSIILPTCGRRSLGRTLQSIREQALAPGDEVLLVTDGPQPLSADLFGRSGLPGRCVNLPATRDFGAAQRNRAMDVAAGDFLLFMDDDDVFTAGAFATIRAALRQAPDRPHLFRMRYAIDGRLLWADRTLALGNISTQMIVFPNRPQLRRWDSRHGHDYRFVANNLPLWPPDSLVWREEVIALIRPHDTESLPAGQPEPPASGPRQVEECPFRDSLGRGREGDAGCCRLLQQILGAEEPRWCEVGRDACTACCASFPPSVIDVNPVLASLVYGRADEIQGQGGVIGCTADRAIGLRVWAEVNLPFDSPSEALPPAPGRSVGPCCYLGPELGFRVQAKADGHSRLPVFECRHPTHRETTLGECHRCRDWADRPGPAPLPVERLVPPPATRRGPKIRHWAVGVTTAPRRQPTLEWCLDSLIRAGWETPRLFVDSAVTIAGRFAHLPVSLRESKLGAWPNFYLTLIELLLREPEADAFLLVQDDVLLYDRGNLREYLEGALWPAEPLGAVSLFCSSAYTRSEPGWYVPDGPWVCGAQAFVLPRESAKRFVTDPLVLEHRWSHHHRGLANIDVVVGQWAARHGLPVCHCSPSLAQHIGHTSTLWPEARGSTATVRPTNLPGIWGDGE